MINYCYLNGDIVDTQAAYIAVDDRGFLLADGLFETLRVYRGVLEHGQAHWQRLLQGARALRIPVPLSYGELTTAVNQLLRLNQLQAAAVRITLTRGRGLRGLTPPAVPVPTVLIATFPGVGYLQHSYSLMFSEYRCNEGSPLSQCKTLAYVEKIAAKLAAAAQGFDDAVLCNIQGDICSTSSANIFMVKQGLLLTPDDSAGALLGIMRAEVIRIAEKKGIPIKKTQITPSELLSAEAIFITNSLIGIQTVSRVQDQFFVSNENAVVNYLLSQINP